MFNTDTFLQNHFQFIVGSAVDAKSVATSKHHASWKIPAISSFLLQSKSYCLSQNHKLTTPSRKAKGGESQPRNFQTHKDQARSMPHHVDGPFPTLSGPVTLRILQKALNASLTAQLWVNKGRNCVLYFYFSTMMTSPGKSSPKY